MGFWGEMTKHLEVHETLGTPFRIVFFASLLIGFDVMLDTSPLTGPPFKNDITNKSYSTRQTICFIPAFLFKRLR